jgi:hypothetical protein
VAAWIWPRKGVRASARLTEVRPRAVCPGRRGVAQLGSALRSGRRGRRFKSGHPDCAAGSVVVVGDTSATEGQKVTTAQINEQLPLIKRIAARADPDLASKTEPRHGAYNWSYNSIREGARHEVIYRGPFLKGYTGKPLLAGDVVRGLIR